MRYYPYLAVRRLTAFGESSDLGRSAKSCQGPDGAAGEILDTPAIRTNPRERLA